MKGIVLAGGAGTRLHPLTRVVSKQLLPIYDKPMIYYPLSVLMLADISEILVISTPEALPQFQSLLGTGEPLGLSFSYAVQERPAGIAEALVIARDFVGDDSVALVLGDNIFHGAGLSGLLRTARAELDGCALFGYRVNDPERYGVAELDARGHILSIEEKPAVPKSPLAVTGLYLYDNDAIDIAANLKPSARGELEITDVNRAFVDRGRAKMMVMPRGMAWLDTGTHDSLLEAGQFVQVLQHRQGTFIAAIEEIAYRRGWIDASQLRRLADDLGQSTYRDYLLSVADAPKGGQS